MTLLGQDGQALDEAQSPPRPENGARERHQSHAENQPPHDHGRTVAHAGR